MYASVSAQIHIPVRTCDAKFVPGLALGLGTEFNHNGPLSQRRSAKCFPFGICSDPCLYPAPPHAIARQRSADRLRSTPKARVSKARSLTARCRSDAKSTFATGRPVLHTREKQTMATAAEKAAQATKANKVCNDATKVLCLHKVLSSHNGKCWR